MNTVNLVDIKKWEETAETLYCLNQQIKELTEQKEKLTNELKVLSYDKTFFSMPYLFEKAVVAGSVDYKAIPELIGVDLEPYRKSPVARWTLKKLEF